MSRIFFLSVIIIIIIIAHGQSLLMPQYSSKPSSSRAHVGKPKPVQTITRLTKSHLSWLVQELSEHSASWMQIGAGLGFTHSELSIVRNTHPGSDPKDCLRQMLSQWLEWAPGDSRGSTMSANLERLQIVLVSVNLTETAEKLRF